MTDQVTDSAATPALDLPMRNWLPSWAVVVATVTLLLFSYKHLAVLAEGGDSNWIRPFTEEFIAVLGAGLLFFPVALWVRRMPLDQNSLWRRLPLYAVALLLFSAIHTSWNWGVRELVFPLVGLGDYDYGRMPLRYGMEFPADVAVFTLMVLAFHGARHLRRSRERELRAARLESGLAQAELRSLHLQIQPHFLFNALNTISSTLYDDPQHADEMIDRLAELLRASLRSARTDEITLDEELRVLGAYLELLKARFEDRLTIEREIDDGVGAARLPPFLLQPLVENAVRHGGVETLGRGVVRLGARRDGKHLVLTVHDDGPGPVGALSEDSSNEDPTSEGVGLSATAERLRLLYGDDHRFEASGNPAGGFRVEIRIPFGP